MYRQQIMEAEQQQQQEQILTKLGELPIVSDTYAQVRDIYERTKGHNALFRTSLGLAEYTAKVLAGKTVPVIYSTLHAPIDKVNDIACNQLEALEEKYPIITKPTEEVLREGQQQYSRVKPYVDPLLKPAQVAVSVASSAVSVGSSVASTAMRPAVYAVNVGTAVTSSVIDSSKHAVSQVASGVMAQGQRVVGASLSTPLGQFWVQQFDAALDATEKLVLNYYLSPHDAEGAEREEGGEEGGSRAERVRALVQHIHNVLYVKAQGDMVRYRMVAGNLLHEIVELTAFYLTLMKDGSSHAWTARKDVLEAFDRIWNKYVQYIPETARTEDPTQRMVVVLGALTSSSSSLSFIMIIIICPQDLSQRMVVDPTQRMVVVLGALTSRVGELFQGSAELRALVRQHLSQHCSDFVHWCQQSGSLLAEGGEDVKERYISQLTGHIPHIMELVQFLSDKILDSLDVFVSPCFLAVSAIVFTVSANVSCLSFFSRSVFSLSVLPSLLCLHCVGHCLHCVGHCLHCVGQCLLSVILQPFCVFFVSPSFLAVSSLCRPLSSLCRPLSSLCRPLSSLCRPLSSLYRPLSSLCRPLSSLYRPLSSLCQPFVFTVSAIVFTVSAIVFTVSAIVFTVSAIVFTVSAIVFTVSAIVFTVSAIVFSLSFFSRSVFICE
ncbi:hypothetical protein ACOMHN_051603 [Nucella lapillus]